MSRSSERGAVFIHVALGLLFLLMIGAWVIDYGAMWVSRAQAQTAADRCKVQFQTIADGGVDTEFNVGAGTRRTGADVDAVRFLFSSGNLASGTWALFGYN